MTDLRNEYDPAWKQILDVYFKDFMALCWPQKYVLVDWDKRYTCLDNQLQKILKNAAISNRIVDKLFKVSLLNGQETCILIHLEIQNQQETDFAERMLVYRYRLRDLHKLPIASIAILTDSNRNWRPSIYREELWDSWLEIGFPVIKITDYRHKIDELHESNNPFAQVILAQLLAMQREGPDARLIGAKLILRRLYSKGWAVDDIMNLLRFLDWVIKLPPELERQFIFEIERLEGELNMEYIPSYFREHHEAGMKVGMQQGMQEGEREMLLKIMEVKFSKIPDSYRVMIKQADGQKLGKWAELVINSHSLAEVFAEV